MIEAITRNGYRIKYIDYDVVETLPETRLQKCSTQITKNTTATDNQQHTETNTRPEKSWKKCPRSKKSWKKLFQFEEIKEKVAITNININTNDITQAGTNKTNLPITPQNEINTHHNHLIHTDTNTTTLPTRTWTCYYCTFINKAVYLQCNICHTLKQSTLPLRVHIHNEHTNETHQINVTQNIPTQQLRNIIHNITYFDTHDHLLIFKGKLLRDDNILHDLNITHVNTTFTIIPTPQQNKTKYITQI